MEQVHKDVVDHPAVYSLVCMGDVVDHPAVRDVGFKAQCCMFVVSGNLGKL